MKLRMWLSGMAIVACDDGADGTADTGGGDATAAAETQGATDVATGATDSATGATDVATGATDVATDVPSDTTAPTTNADTSVDATEVLADVTPTCAASMMLCGGACVTPEETTVDNDQATTSTVTSSGQVRQGVKDVPAGPHAYAAVRIWLEAGLGEARVVLPVPDGEASSAPVDVTTSGWHTFTFDPPVRPSGNIRFPTATASEFTLRFSGTQVLPTTLNVYTGALTNLTVTQPGGANVGDTSNDLRFAIDFRHCE